ncbi:MAG: hypothetical protein HN675_00645 [Opitutae bacterium]|nr:hypothetical protein [Opitutae bacterium]
MKNLFLGYWHLLFSGCVGLLFAACTHYDVETADTPANRGGFERHFGFVPDASVTKVYYYADELGIDASYQLSFKCSRETIKRIIEKLSLESVPPERADSLLAPRDDLPWWNPDSIDNRELWLKEEENAYYWQLWYSDRDQMAFYLEYSV